MALQVWLPLNKNGDLKNQGLADVTVTNNGATYNASGKIGGCYTGFNTGLMTLNKEAMSTLSGEFTISCWIKINSYSSNYQTVWSGCSTSASWNNMIMVLLRNGGGSNLIFCISNNSSATESLCSAGTIELGNWMHITCCYKPGHIITYKNGILVLDYSTSIIPNVSTITSCLIGRDYGSYPNDMNINDFRIYDHCLTPQEVKEISKGLICHYTCDDISLYNGKLYDSSGYCNDLTIIGSPTANTDTPRNNKCAVFGTGIHAYNPSSGVAGASGNELTVSCWFYQTDRSGYQGLVGNRGTIGSTSSASPLNWYLYTHSTDGSLQFHGSGQNKSTVIPTLNTWHHVVAVVKSGNTYDMYLDGEKVISNVSYTWGGTTQRLVVSGYGSSGECFRGRLSDIRVYTTALSANDVKELYNTAAFVDNHGNVECFQAYEDSDSQVMKTGQVKTEEFKEVSKNLFNKDEVAFNSCNYGSVPNAFTMNSYTGKCTPAKSIPIKPNTWYVLSYNETTVSVNSQAFNTTWWDITGKVKVAEDTSGGSLGFYNKVKLKSPANAYFVSFSNFGALSDANLQILVNSLQLEEGEAFTSYEPHFIDVASVYNNKIECNQLIEI